MPRYTEDMVQLAGLLSGDALRSGQHVIISLCCLHLLRFSQTRGFNYNCEPRLNTSLRKSILLGSNKLYAFRSVLHFQCIQYVHSSVEFLLFLSHLWQIDRPHHLCKFCSNHMYEYIVFTYRCLFHPPYTVQYVTD